MFRNEDYNKECRMPPGIHRQVSLDNKGDFFRIRGLEFNSLRTYNKMDRIDPDFLRIQKSILTHWSQRDEHQEGATMNKVGEEDNLDPITGQYQGIPPIYIEPKKIKSTMKKVMNQLLQ